MVLTIVAVAVVAASLGLTLRAQGGGGGGSDAHTGDVLGDLIHIKRDLTTGQPILQMRQIELPGDTVGLGYCPIPVDELGLEIPFVPLSCDPDPAYASALVEVDYFGRLSGGRTQERNLRMHFDETILGIKSAERVELDPGGRLLLGTDCTSTTCASWRTIDSPMENLSLYRWLMKYGHLQTDPTEEDTSPGGDPSAGTVYHPALDADDWLKFVGPVTALLPRASSGECFSGATFVAACAAPQSLTATDFFLAGALLGGAADKTGKITIDLLQYLNRILKITEDTPGSLATLNTLPALIRDEAGVITPAPTGLPFPASERFVDYGPASYLRSDWFSRSVVVLQNSGSAWVETTVDLMTWLNFINGPMTTPATSAAAFLASSNDALRVIEFVHEYAVPADLWARLIATTTTVEAVTVPYSSLARNVTLRATVASLSASPVSAGSVTFAVRTSLAVPIGVPVTSLVTDGLASATYVVPAGTSPQTLTVIASYAPAPGFASSQGAGSLTIAIAATNTTVMPVVAPLSASPFAASLSATVGVPTGESIGEGIVNFTVRDSAGTVIGAPVSGPVVSGAVTAAYTLPGGLPAQRLTITGTYSGTAHYALSTGANLMAVGCVPVTILPAVLPSAVPGQPYSQALTTDGLTPEVFSLAGTLPPGLTFSGAILSGVPTTAGTYAFTVDVVDLAACTGTRSYSLQVRSLGAAMVTGSGVGTEALVRLFDAAGSVPADYPGPTELRPFPELTTGVRVAQGDVTGDGVPDTIAATGPGGGSHVVVSDGLTGSVIREFWAFEYYSGGGAFVASGDVNRDGVADILVSQGHGPARVRVFNGATLAILHDLSPTELGASGVRVASGDVDGDGHADVILGSGPEAVPAVRVYSGATGSLLRNLTTFGGSLPGGVFVAAGDINGDGRADIITGAGEGTAPLVQVFDGGTLAELRSFMAFDPSFLGGVRVASVDLSGDGRAEIIATVGPGAPPAVLVFDGQTGTLTTSFLAYAPSMVGGVYLGAGR